MPRGNRRLPRRETWLNDGRYLLLTVLACYSLEPHRQSRGAFKPGKEEVGNVDASDVRYDERFQCLARYRDVGFVYQTLFLHLIPLDAKKEPRIELKLSKSYPKNATPKDVTTKEQIALSA